MRVKKLLFLLLLVFTVNTFAENNTAQDNTDQDNIWRGLKIAEENRCAPYNRLKDYFYPQEIENQIIESLGNQIYSPYSGEFFNSKDETDIEHIVSLSEAHDSGLCAADEKTKSLFASDIQNLTLASPTLNRDEKSGHDATHWVPEKNKCWFANQVIKVKKAYDLTVDSEELIALEKILSQCESFEMVFFNKPLKQKNQDTKNSLAGPNVKKSNTHICHRKNSSPYYSMVKYYQSFEDIYSCLNDGGRCPKKDLKCQKMITENKPPASKQQANVKQQATSKQQVASKQPPATNKPASNPHATSKQEVSKQPASKQQVSHQAKKTNNAVSETKKANDKGSGEPRVKKSRSGICHLKESSSSYSRTKNFTAFNNLESCLNTGGRCPKRDLKCQSVASSNMERKPTSQ